MTYYNHESHNRLAYEYDPDINAYTDDDEDEWDECDDYICTADYLDD